MVYLLFLTILFFFVMYAYFKVADHYNIIDKPNERSSHTIITIRGGGIIFLLAIIISGILHADYWIPTLGAIIIGIISFLDDRITLSSKVRIIFHLLAVSLLFYFLSLFWIAPWWIVVVLYIFTIGVINAYNFMDGINGITGLYSLIVLGGLQYVNLYVRPFINADLIWLPIIASLVFLYFNFRKKAKCFAGDVGSVTIAFWIIMLIMQLIIKTNNYSYILFLVLYGVDAVLTIIHRLFLKQNIFDAHRLHFYQILANDQKIPHLVVTSIYAALQLVIIVLVVFSHLNQYMLWLITLFPLIFIYILMKPRLMINSL